MLRNLLKTYSTRPYKVEEFLSGVLALAWTCAVIISIGSIITSCANTTTSKYSFKTEDGKAGEIELPKDIHAVGLKIKTSSGATIEADEITSIGRVDQTLATAEREKIAAELAGEVAEGAVKGAVKGAKGF